MTLEDKVGNTKENRGLIGKALSLGFSGAVATGATLLSTSFVGLTGVFVGSALGLGTLVGGLYSKIKNKTKSYYEIIKNTITNYATVNTIISPIIWLGDVTFPLIEKLVYYAAPNETLLARAAQAIYGITAYNAAFVGMFRGTKDLINNYLIPNPKRMWNAIKDNFYNDYFRVGTSFAFFGYPSAAWGVHPLLNIAGYNIPNFAVNALPFGTYNAAVPLKTEKTEDQWMNPLYVADGFRKYLTGIVGDVYSAIGGAGNALRGGAPTPPTPAAATQTA